MDKEIFGVDYKDGENIKLMAQLNKEDKPFYYMKKNYNINDIPVDTASINIDDIINFYKNKIKLEEEELTKDHITENELVLKCYQYFNIKTKEILIKLIKFKSEIK